MHRFTLSHARPPTHMSHTPNPAITTTSPGTAATNTAASTTTTAKNVATTTTTPAPKQGDKKSCNKLISENQGRKGGYQFCSHYSNEGPNPYIAVETDLECQQKCLETPNCIYATRYKDESRKFPKKNCHIISLCGRLIHYADDTGCVQPNQPSCVYRQSMV